MKKLIAILLTCLMLLGASACIKQKEAETDPAPTPIPVKPTDTPAPVPTEQPTLAPAPTDDPDGDQFDVPNTDVTDDVFDATESLTPEERGLRSYWIKAAKYNEVTGKNETIYWRVFSISSYEVEYYIQEYNRTHDDKIPLIKSNDIMYYVAAYEVFYPRDWKEPEDGKGIRDTEIKLEITDEKGNDMIVDGTPVRARVIETHFYDVHAGSCYRGQILYPMYVGQHYLFEYKYYREGSSKELSCYSYDGCWEGPPELTLSWEEEYNWEDFAWAYE